MRLAHSLLHTEIAFDCTAWDTAQLDAEGSAHFFVEPSAQTFRSATETDEHRLVELLLSERLTRTLLLRVLGVPDDALWAARVQEPFTTPNSKPGDIDMVLASREAPQRAIVGEAKWVKVREGGSSGQRVNKLIGAEQSATQVAGLVKLGFSRAFLVLVAVVDDRSGADSNFLFRGTSTSSLRRLVEFSDAIALDSAAGILYIELSQPLPKNVKQAAVVCAGILRPATYREQSTDLTAMVSSYLASRGRGA